MNTAVSDLLPPDHQEVTLALEIAKYRLGQGVRAEPLAALSNAILSAAALNKGGVVNEDLVREQRGGCLARARRFDAWITGHALHVPDSRPTAHYMECRSQKCAKRCAKLLIARSAFILML